MWARPRSPEHRAAGRGRGHQSADVAATISRAVPDPEGRPRLCDCDRRLPRRLQRSRLHRQGRAHLRRPDPDPVRTARGKTVRARRRFRDSQSGRHRWRSRRRLARIDRRPWQPVAQRRDAAARQPGAAGSRTQIAEARRADRSQRTRRRHPAQGRPRPHLLCGRRHLARAGAHPHHPERLSAEGDARLFDPRSRCARFRAAPAPAGCRQHAGQYRGRRRCPPAAPHLRGAGARTHHPGGETEDDRVLDLRRPRGPVVRKAAAGRARQGRLDLRDPER